MRRAATPDRARNGPAVIGSRRRRLCVSRGADIGETLVSQGLALAYAEYSRAYEAQEAETRAARRGIWRGEVQAPWDWRRAKRAGQGTPDPAPERVEAGGCAIKGNISGGGRIYHMPGDPYYGRTKIDTGAGERWFCSEAEARRALAPRRELIPQQCFSSCLAETS